MLFSFLFCCSPLRTEIRGNKWASVCSCQSGAVGAEAVSTYTTMSTSSPDSSFPSVSHISCVFYLYLHPHNKTCSISCRPAPVVPSETKRKWCHATTTALRGTIVDPGSGETSVLLASTMEEPIIAVPLLLSMATTVRDFSHFQSFPPSSPPRLQLPWQHPAAT